MIMKCKNCKYRKNIGNTSETGSAICSYSSSWFTVNIENNCRFIPEKKALTCGDCSRLGKIRHVLTALKMTVQYIMDNCAEGLWMNGKKNRLECKRPNKGFLLARCTCFSSKIPLYNRV